MTSSYIYELLEISWMLNYDLNLEVPVRIVRDDSTFGVEPSPEPANTAPEDPPIVYDADGIPMGKSMEEIRLREAIIDAFFRRWYQEHPQKEVYNSIVAGNIQIRKISIDEAKQHASKNYLSTIAIVHHFDEILSNAMSIGKTAIKENDRNQAQFDYMLIMSYRCQGIGLVKLTVGIRKKLTSDHAVEEIKTEYGISALPDGQKIEIPRKADKKKKKAPHKK